MSRSIRRGLTLLAMVIVVLIAMPTVALAHPLGNYTINTGAGLHLQPGQVRVEYVVDMAEIPVAQLRPTIDANHDGVLSQTEGTDWAQVFAPTLLPNLSLSVDGKPVALQIRSTSMRFRPGQGGLPILRFEGLFVGSVDRTGTIDYRDGNFPDHIGWREITAVGEDGEAVLRDRHRPR